MAVKRKADPVKFDELGVSSKEQLRYFRDMLLIRRFEERAGQMYGMGLIGGLKRVTRSSPPIAITGTCWPAAWIPRA